jgi:hypothetical protein
MSKAKQYLTRKELPDHIKEQHGIPVSKSAIEKLGWQGKLKPDRWYGKMALYTPQTAAKLAKELLSADRTNLRLNREPDPPEAA